MGRKSWRRWSVVALSALGLTAAVHRFSVSKEDGFSAAAAPRKVRDDLFSVASTDPSSACVVGAWGTILLTRDRGETWAKRPSGTERALLDVSFADPKHGWIVGEDGIVLASVDGGESWAPQKSPIATHLFSVFAIQPEVAWAVGNEGKIIRTGDGGTSWVDRSLDRDVILNKVLFLDADHGWIVGEFGTILRTTDGGATWTPAEALRGAPQEPYFFGVAFGSLETGYVTGLAGLVLITRDGGRTWSRLPFNYEEHFLDVAGTPQAVVMVGSRGNVARFLPDGDGMKLDGAVQTGLKSWLRRVAFTDATHGWAVGAGGNILLTADGGSTWQILTP